ncbi:MAG: DUF2752 domain-containing protein [Propionicimonas sp.]
MGGRTLSPAFADGAVVAGPWVTVGLIAWAATSIGSMPRAEILPECVIHQLTGIYCPGCGGLRAVFDLTRGELLSALRNNALLVLIPVWLALGFLASSHRLLGRPFLAGHHRLLTRLAIASIAVVTVFTIVRNQAWASWLQPT